MKDLPFVASIAERDMDFVIFEELSVNREFCDWFTARVYGKPLFASLMGAWHSVNDAQLGETDILYMFRSEDDGRFAVLIENKIDAAGQPRQAQRYRLRGEKGKQAKEWDDCITCMIAPEKYLSGANQADGYDARLSYEELLAFFISRRSRDERYHFKARLVLEAIEKHRRGYQPEISTAMTAFVRDYRVLALGFSPNCGIQDAKSRPAGSNWIMFKPAGLPAEVSLVHQLTRGFAKLLIAGGADKAEELRVRFSPYLVAGFEFATAGKSASVSIAVPRIDPLTHSVDEQEEQIRRGVAAIDHLAGIYKQAYALKM